MGHPARASRPGPRPRVELLIALLLCAAALLGCAPGRGPELLELDEVSPTALEQGARLEILGSGFPDRRRARVTFRGTLFRPGHSPRELTAHFEAVSESSSLLSLPVTREVLARFVADGPHTTFRGRVSVHFPSLHASAPALSGSRDGLVLDWFSEAATRHGAEQDLRAEATRFLELTGFRVDESLVVTSIHPEGEAQRRGLALGDQLIALDGVRVDTLADLVPRADGWQSSVTVRREHGDELLPPWDRSGLRPVGLADLPGAFVWVMGALALLLLCVGAHARGWAHIEARLASRRSGSAPGFSAGVRRLLAPRQPVLAPSELTPNLPFAPYAVSFLVFTLWSAIALGHPQVITWVDLPTLLLAGFGGVLLASFVLGGHPPGARGFRLVPGLAAALGALFGWLPVVLAVAAVVFEVGSLQLADLVAGQGELPHQWRACASPWALLALVLLVGSCVPKAGPHRATLGPDESRGLAPSLARLLEWFAIALTCGLGAALFLGGWTHTPSDSTFELPSVPGAGLFLLKTWLLMYVVSWWRAVLGGVRRSEVLGIVLTRALPLSAVSFGLHALTSGSSFASAHEAELRLATVASATLVGGYFLLRAARVRRGPSGHIALNPWL